MNTIILVAYLTLPLDPVPIQYQLDQLRQQQFDYQLEQQQREFNRDQADFVRDTLERRERSNQEIQEYIRRRFP